MAVLLLAYHNNTALGDATIKTMSAAKALGGEVHVLVAGSQCGTVAEAAAKLDGAAKVLLADAPQFANGLAEEMSGLIVPLMASYDALVAPATASGKNILPRVAAAARRDADLRHHQGRLTRHLRAADLRRQRHPDGAVQRSQEGHHRARHRPSRLPG